MKYRKKPVVIDVWKWPEDKKYLEEKKIVTAYLHNGYFIKTLEGEMRVSDGDYVIRGIKGEYYPCKPDIFDLTYEKEA